MTCNTKRKPLVPITREFLKQFYQKYPLEPVPPDAKDAHMRRVDELSAAVTKQGSRVPEQFGMETPTRIDDCFWRNRMICEETASSLRKLQDSFKSEPDLAAACERCASILLSAEQDIVAVQDHNTASVKEQLQQFIPQDFRGALLERHRTSTEARYKKQIQDLVSKGGSIRRKYEAYLQQQWERRQSLVQLGECSGMYKMVIKWVAGIPQVLLDFAKEINAKLGPMEEQRIKYGPDLYGITTLGFRLDVCLAAWAENAAETAENVATVSEQLVTVVEPAVHFYCEHMLRVVRFIGNVFQHSPFFVSKDDLECGGTDVDADACETGTAAGATGSGDGATVSGCGVVCDGALSMSGVSVASTVPLTVGAHDSDKVMAAAAAAATDPSKMKPIKVEPIKVEPIKLDPAKAAMDRSSWSAASEVSAAASGGQGTMHGKAVGPAAHTPSNTNKPTAAAVMMTATSSLIPPSATPPGDPVLPPHLRVQLSADQPQRPQLQLSLDGPLLPSSPSLQLPVPTTPTASPPLPVCPSSGREEHTPPATRTQPDGPETAQPVGQQQPQLSPTPPTPPPVALAPSSRSRQGLPPLPPLSPTTTTCHPSATRAPAEHSRSCMGSIGSSSPTPTAAASTAKSISTAGTPGAAALSPRLVHTPTPSPHLLLPMVAGLAGRSSGRGSMTGESCVSFCSAEESQPWYLTEDGGGVGGTMCGSSPLSSPVRQQLAPLSSPVRQQLAPLSSPVRQQLVVGGASGGSSTSGGVRCVGVGAVSGSGAAPGGGGGGHQVGAGVQAEGGGSGGRDGGRTGLGRCFGCFRSEGGGGGAGGGSRHSKRSAPRPPRAGMVSSGEGHSGTGAADPLKPIAE